MTISGSVSNVTVRNGIIADAPSPIAFGGAQANILIENITVSTVANAVGNKIAIFSAGGTTGLTIRDVTVYNGSPTNIDFNNIGGSYDGVVLENITCIGTNPAFTPIPGAASVSFISCKNLVLKNISLIDQPNVSNGIFFATCSDVVVDGVLITSQLATPGSATTAYEITLCTDCIHKNVVIDGGANTVFSIGVLVDVNSRYITMDSCDVYRCNHEGFNLSSFFSTYKNCSAQNNGTFGFLTTGTENTFIDCTAMVNTNSGFGIDSLSNMYNCIALDNTINGFIVSGNQCSLRNCSSANNPATGFLLSGTGMTLSYCSATANATGFITSNTDTTLSFCTATANVTGFSITGTNTVLQQCLASNNSGAGIDNTSGTNTQFIDTRSSSTTAPTYQLNGSPDNFGAGATFIIF